MSLVKIANKLPKLNGMFFGVYVMPPIPTYKITLFPSQNGSISADTLEGIEGTLVTLSNTPDTHYSFGGYGITGATLTGNQFLIGQDDISVQGSFIEDAKYSLSLTQTTGGRINANKNTGYAGDIITLSNTPSSHYSFNGYSITGATLTGNQFAFGSQNVTAKGTFVADPIRTVTLTQVAGGNITANPTTGYDGTTVTLSNTANAGYTFNNYTLTGGTLTGNKFVLNGGNATASLNLTHNVYNLTLQTDGHGKLVAGKTTGYYNDTTTLSTTASAGYNFKNYSVTGGTITNNTFKWGTSNATAKANFSAKPVRSVTLSQQTGGTIAANPMTGYDGTVVTLSNTANAGYTFNNYNITGATLTGNQFKLTGSNVTVKPKYTHNVYKLTLQTNGHGKLAAGKTTGYYNDTTTLTATPSSNYKFKNYSVTGGTITNNAFKWGTANATAKANFIYNANSARIALGYNTTPTAIVSAGKTYYPYTVQVAAVVKGITGEIPFDIMCNCDTACIYAHDNNTPNSYSMGNRVSAMYYSNSGLDHDSLRNHAKRVVLHGGTHPFEVRYRSNLNNPTDYAKCWMLYSYMYVGTPGNVWGPDQWETLSTMNTKKNGYSMYNTTFNTVAYDGVPSGLIQGCWIQYNLDYQNSVYSWPDQFISKQNDIVDIYW